MLTETAAAIRSAARSAAKGLVEREVLVDLLLLAAVAREHLLIIGPPGTGKSAAVRRVSKAFGGHYFEYLLGRFTEPSELFGPVDLRKLRDGIIETATEGMLPEAEIAFLDEVFLGSTAVLNTLLGILNERQFRRGHTRISCPLRLCVAAANQLPDDESLGAFADRFLLHYFVEPVPDSQLESLLEQGWQSDHEEPGTQTNLAALDLLAKQAQAANMKPVQPRLARCIRLLRKENIQLSDRRIVKSQRLIGAAAALDGRDTPGEGDIWPLLYVIPGAEEQQQARDLLRDELDTTENVTLTAAAEYASQGPLARAQRLVEQGQALLARPREEREPFELEALGREIDAGFAPNTLPEALRNIREKLLEALGEVE